MAACERPENPRSLPISEGIETRFPMVTISEKQNPRSLPISEGIETRL